MQMDEWLHFLVVLEKNDLHILWQTCIAVAKCLELLFNGKYCAIKNVIYPYLEGLGVHDKKCIWHCKDCKAHA